MKEYMRLKMLKDLKNDNKPFYEYIISQKELGNDKYEKEILDSSKIEILNNMGKLEDSRGEIFEIRFLPINNLNYDSKMQSFSYDNSLTLQFSLSSINENIISRKLLTCKVNFKDDDLAGYVDHQLQHEFVYKNILQLIIFKLRTDYDIRISQLKFRDKTIDYRTFKYNYTKQSKFEFKKEGFGFF